MSPRARFAIEGIAIAVVLYALLRLLTASQPDYWWLGYTTAAIAVMLAAQGVSWNRKLLFAGVSALVSIAAFELVARTFLVSGADVLRTSGVSGASHMYFAAFMIMQVLFTGLPLAALALFVGRRPDVLWTARDVPAE